MTQFGLQIYENTVLITLVANFHRMLHLVWF